MTCSMCGPLTGLHANVVYELAVDRLVVAGPTESRPVPRQASERRGRHVYRDDAVDGRAGQR